MPTATPSQPVAVELRIQPGAMRAITASMRTIERKLKRHEITVDEAHTEQARVNLQYTEYRKNDGPWRPLSDYAQSD